LFEKKHAHVPGRNIPGPIYIETFPRKFLQSALRECDGGNAVPMALFQRRKRPPSPKNDARHLRSQCADAPVFKMPRLAKGKFYDARTTVENFVDCEEAVGTPTNTSRQELLRKGKVNVGLFGILDGVTRLERHKE
jgi:hypothetical protein